MAKLRAGVIGLGMGNNHFNGYLSHPDVEVVAIADRREDRRERAKATCEEHNIIGGLGSAVAEVVCESKPVPVVRVGVNDTYGKSGKAQDLIPVFGLDAQSVVNKVKEAINLK